MIRLPAIGLVALREITQRLSGRATWILTVLTTVLAVGLIVVPALVNQSSGATRLGLVGAQAQDLGPAIVATAKVAGIDVTATDVDSEATARSELTPPAGGGGGRVTIFRQARAALDVAVFYDGDSARIEAYRTVPADIAAVVRAVINASHQHGVLAAAGLPTSQITAAERPVPLTTDTIETAPSDRAGRQILALATAFLLMYSVAGFGAAVATGVAQEKTSRTAEVLLGALKPWELMTGKVLGIGVVGLAQMTITVGAAMIANSVVKSQTVPAELPTLLPMIIVWFVLGFTLYAFGFAAAGAMVARQEEVQSVTMPFTAVLVAGILMVYATIASPDAPWVRLVSFLPPLSPILMPARLALGPVAVWELLLAMAIELVSIAAIAGLAGRIYRGALVRGGARLSWASALRLR